MVGEVVSRVAGSGRSTAEAAAASEPIVRIQSHRALVLVEAAACCLAAADRVRLWWQGNIAMLRFCCSVGAHPVKMQARKRKRVWNVR